MYYSIIKQTLAHFQILLLVKYELFFRTDFRLFEDPLGQVVHRGRFIRSKRALFDLVVEVNQVDPQLDSVLRKLDPHRRLLAHFLCIHHDGLQILQHASLGGIHNLGLHRQLELFKYCQFEVVDEGVVLAHVFHLDGQRGVFLF